MKLESFKKKVNKKRKSTLEEFKDDIFELHVEGYSLQTISDYLKTKDIKTCISNISRFISRNSKKTLTTSSTSKTKSKSKKVEDDEQIEEWAVKIKTNNPILEALNK